MCAVWSGRLHFEPSVTFQPLPLWMELDLALAARRAVAFMSIPAEWLTFIHCPLELTLELTGCCARAHDFVVAECECLPRWNVTRSTFCLAGRGALHLWHGNTDRHQRVF